MLDWVEPLLAWVGEHPTWALLIVLALSFADAMFLIGLLFPSYVILFGVGALVALDKIELWPAVAASSAGAMLGDLFNYTIGRRYGERILASRLAARYGETIKSARRFFFRHGAKGLILGRFVGVIRPFVPAVAAASGMRFLPFLCWDLVACVTWSVAFVFPGIAVGASLHLAAEIALRLLLLLLFAFALVWALLAISRGVSRYVQHHAEVWLVWLLRWSGRHRRVGRLGGWLADPDQPETPALLILAALFLVIGWLGLGLSWWLLRGHPQALDAVVYQALSELHSPWGLVAASWINLLGEVPVMLMSAAAAFISLATLHQGRAAAHLAAGVAFGAIIAAGLYTGVQLAEPVQFYGEGLAHSRFAGGDLIITTIVYGLLPVLLSVGRSASVRARYYGIAVVMVGLIAASELYLGLQWFSTAVFAMAIGLLWTVVLAIGYRRHNARRVPGRRFFMPVLLCFICALIAFAPFRARAPQQARQPQQHMTQAQWLKGGYAHLPAYRADLGSYRHQPLNVQWVGSAEQIGFALLGSGWQRPAHLTPVTALRMLAPDSRITDLPVLPQVHNGRHPDLVLTRPLPRHPGQDEHEAVLRLWASGWSVDGDTLWVGNLSEQSVRVLVYLLQVPVSLQDYDLPQRALELPRGTIDHYVSHPGYDAEAGHWNGNVRLILPVPPNEDD